MIRSQKGSILMETAVSCLILVVFLFGFIDVSRLIQSSIYVQRIAREGAREAALTGDKSTAELKAEEMAQQYFNNDRVKIVITLPGNSCVECRTVYSFRPLLMENSARMEEDLHGKAVFPWHDEIKT